MEELDIAYLRFQKMFELFNLYYTDMKIADSDIIQ